MQRRTSVNKILGVLGLDETHSRHYFYSYSEELETTKTQWINKCSISIGATEELLFPFPSVVTAMKIGFEQMRCDRTSFRYHCIFTILIVAKVKIADLPVSLFGGTIIHGHGAGRSVIDAAFPISIEPEKDIVMQVVLTEQVPKIRQTLINNLKLNEPNSGILFVLPVSRATGLFESKVEVGG